MRQENQRGQKANVPGIVGDTCLARFESYAADGAGSPARQNQLNFGICTLSHQLAMV
jgi:hypothetical protein